MSVVVIDRLTKKFGSKTAVANLKLELKVGEIYGFLGPNGAGKTTTIRCVMDFLRPTSGQITVFGLDSRTHSAAIKQRVGFLSSDNRLYDHWTVKEHLDFAQSLRGRAELATKLVRELALDTRPKFKNLSSGNKQKLGLILALMNQPDLLILDEPTRGLDPILQNQFYQILLDFKRRGGSVFMSSHNLSEVEQVCDHVGIIRDGRLIKSETLARLRQLKTHLITAVTVSKITAADFRLPHTSIESHADSTIMLKVKGDLNRVLRVLAKYEIKDLSVTHASLEDIFLEYYR